MHMIFTIFLFPPSTHEQVWHFFVHSMSRCDINCLVGETHHPAPLLVKSPMPHHASVEGNGNLMQQRQVWWPSL